MFPVMSENRKKPGPTPGAKSVQVTLRLEPPLYEALVEWCAAQRVPPTEQDAIRIAVREFLERENAWPVEMKTKNPG